MQMPPPYWKLHDYVFEGQFGQEAKPEYYIENLIERMSEWRRVLPDWGNVFVNFGDIYNNRSFSIILNTARCLVYPVG